MPGSRLGASHLTFQLIFSSQGSYRGDIMVSILYTRGVVLVLGLWGNGALLAHSPFSRLWLRSGFFWENTFLLVNWSLRGFVREALDTCKKGCMGSPGAPSSSTGRREPQCWWWMDSYFDTEQRFSTCWRPLIVHHLLHRHPGSSGKHSRRMFHTHWNFES